MEAMKFFRCIVCYFVGVLTALAILPVPCVMAGEPLVIRPAYAAGPADNPLKGFVPYAGQGREFPHSLEFGYLSLASVMTGPTNFNWAPLDQLLDGIASRGCQAVFRFYLEYPRKPSGVPEYLAAAGVKMRVWTNTNTSHSRPRLTTRRTTRIHAYVQRSPISSPLSARVMMAILASVSSRPGCSGRGASGTVTRIQNGSRPRGSRQKSWMVTMLPFAKRRSCYAIRPATTTMPMPSTAGGYSAITTIPSLGPHWTRAVRTKIGFIWPR